MIVKGAGVQARAADDVRRTGGGMTRTRWRCASDSPLAGGNWLILPRA